jgi:hypothetical protein
VDCFLCCLPYSLGGIVLTKVKLRDAIIQARKKYGYRCGCQYPADEGQLLQQAPGGDLVTWVMNLSEIDFKRSVNLAPYQDLSCDRKVERQMTESPCPKGNPMKSDIPERGGVRE